jgi:hypothetical protein
MDVRRSVSATACAAALMLTAVPTAAAAGADPWLAGLARRLRADPVYVSDSVSRAVSPGELSRLRAAVRAMPFATRVAILGGVPGNVDVPGLDLFDLPDLLGGALDRSGLYVVADAADAYSSALQMTAIGVRPAVPADEVEHAVADDVVQQTRVVARVRYALRVAATGERPLEGAADRELAAQDAGYRDSDRTEGAVAIASAVGGGLAVFLVLTVRWWRRRPRRARRERVAPVVREPAADTAGRASEAVARLAAAIAAVAQPADAAFDLYSAAAKAEREARTPVDSLGALMLARDGQDALAGRPRRRRCFFDPRHPGDTTPTRWRLGHEEAEVPACASCERALHAGTVPDVLGDRGRPYYERDTVWARTGFGAVDDELAAKVLSGR